MNENKGKLIPIRRASGEVTQPREYTVNLGGRKKDWLDYVGAFLEDPEPKKDTSFGAFLRSWKNKPVATALELFPLVGLVAVGTFCVMDTYHWNFSKAGDDFFRATMPYGAAIDDFTKGVAQPAYRPRPGDSTETTQRRRDCLTAVIEHVDGRYIVAAKKFPRAPLDFCETSEGLTPPVKNDGRSR